MQSSKSSGSSSFRSSAQACHPFPRTQTHISQQKVAKSYPTQHKPLCPRISNQSISPNSSGISSKTSMSLNLTSRARINCRIASLGIHNLESVLSMFSVSTCTSRVVMCQFFILVIVLQKLQCRMSSNVTMLAHLQLTWYRESTEFVGPLGVKERASHTFRRHTGHRKLQRPALSPGPLLPFLQIATCEMHEMLIDPTPIIHFKA